MPLKTAAKFLNLPPHLIRGGAARELPGRHTGGGL
jgi:hypothetical protein